MSTEAMQAAKASYERCCDQPEFFHSFYQNFFEACPDAKPMFARTDFDRQARVLRHAINLLLIFPNQPPAEPTLLSRLAERHSRRDLNVNPEWYPLFLSSLVHTVAAYDPEFSQDLNRAWHTALSQGMEYMRSRY